MMRRLLLPPFLAVAICLIPVATHAEMLLTGGHYDITVRPDGQIYIDDDGVVGLQDSVIFTPDNSRPLVHNDQPTQQDLSYPGQTRFVRYEGDDWEFVGVQPGEMFWRLPRHGSLARQDGNWAVPFPGFALHDDDIGAGAVWEDIGDRPTYVVHGVTAPEGGHFALYNTFLSTVENESGRLETLHEVWAQTFDNEWDSDNGWNVAGPRNWPPHGHAAWAFSKPGDYEITIRAFHTDFGVDGFADGTLRFHVVPEPATWAMLLSGAVVVAVPAARRWRRGRKAAAEQETAAQQA